MRSTNPFRKSENSQTVDVTRRRFLATGAAGVAGIGALGSLGSAAAAPDQHLLTIEGTGYSTNYSFTVGGDLEQVTAEGATIQDNDNVVMQSAHGEVSNGKDAYTFTGPLYSFNFDESNDISVKLDGESAYVGNRADHTLLIEGTGPSTTYSFSAYGLIQQSEAYGASRNSRDRTNSYGGEGEVSIGKDAYTYSGDLVAFEFDQAGAIRATIDGKAAHVGQRPDYALTIVANDGYVEYEVEIDGNIREVTSSDGSPDSVDGNTFSGTLQGVGLDRFTYDGEIESFTHSGRGDFSAYRNYQQIK
ncbi:pre-peptidase [Halococcus salsus]|uniref:pre-peptidase n=1 Tax=Halococcus salsus TaxID=2162894 RepID=UPI00135CECD9|nr:pre-peptidase [Halococcus salsus]